jgi:hypothetical protein
LLEPPGEVANRGRLVRTEPDQGLAAARVIGALIRGYGGLHCSQLGLTRSLAPDEDRRTAASGTATARKHKALGTVPRALLCSEIGWRARIRTWNPLIQSQVLYR